MLRVQCVWTAVGLGESYTNFHFTGSGEPAAQSAVDSVSQWFAGISTLINLNVLFQTNPEVLEIEPGSGDVDDVHIVDSYEENGVSNIPRVADSTQALMRWNTATFRGARRIKGRTFVPGLHTGNVENGQVTAPAQATLLSASEQLINDPAIRPALVVYSRNPGGIGGVGIAATVIDGTVWNEFAVLTSRRS